MAKKGLRDALDNYRGKDRSKEHELNRQKKMQKDAAKRKQAHGAKKSQEEVLEDAQDDAMEVVDKDVASEEVGEDDEWESDSDEEAEAGFDLSRLEDSDSDSDDDDDEGNSSNPVLKVLASLKANGIPKPTPAATKSKSPKTTTPTTKSKASTTPALPAPAATTTKAAEDSDNDDASSASSIPLSDLSSTANSATEDLIPHQRLTINNLPALTRAVTSIALPTATLPFSEHQSLTTATATTIPDIDDDLNRELAFYSQSLTAVKEARRLLAAEGVNFTRPADYFAEMVKSDEHMGKIKAKLVDDAASKRAAADARKQRDLKRFGKQVQQEKLKERAMAKNQMLDKVKSLKRKRQQGGGLETTQEEGLFDVALEDAATTERKDREDRRKSGGKRGLEGGQPGAKRAKKNEKFGFGGKKRFAKSGDAMSSGDMSGFSHKKMKGKDKGGAAKRLGKARRAKAR